MKSTVHILHLEDDPNDVLLVHSVLKRDCTNCTITHVQTEEEFVSELEHGAVDLILSDYSLPRFDGLSALRIVNNRWPAIPFIFVTGTIGEERAIETLKSGATDYVLKNRLSRLAPAVRRAIEEIDARMENLRLEMQVIEGQKLEIFGQLTSGVAHDFGNILGIIKGYNDLLSRKTEADSDLRRYSEAIHVAAEQGVALTRQLMTYSKKEKIKFVSLNLNSTVTNLERMLRRLIRENIGISIDLDKEAGLIEADAGYVGQVLMNLVINARDAMPGGGKLVISTKCVQLETGDHLMLRVSDTGTGMTDEVKARLFENFFTTKAPGKGTGLGLATCQTIVQQCGGTIDVISELGKGTTFMVYFPCIKKSGGHEMSA